MSKPQATPLSDVEITPAPTDGITAMRIIDNRFLLVSSWDTHVRLYDLTSNTLKTTYQHKAGVLDCTFSDKYTCYSGGIDKILKSFNLTAGTETILGLHEKPIKCTDFNTEYNLVVTGSWDGTVKLWDPRASQTLVSSHDQSDKIFSLSTMSDKLVVGTAQRQVNIFDLKYMDEPQQRRESSLKFQTRCIRCFPNGTGYALSSIEGRVAMEYFDPSPQVQSRKYAFKCHRTTESGVDTVYPVNAIGFNQKYGTFATGGCDGVVNVWDGENKKRLAQYMTYPTSIAAVAFSEDATILAIASSYTFEEGEKDHAPDQIFVRTVQDHEVRPKMKTDAV